MENKYSFKTEMIKQTTFPRQLLLKNKSIQLLSMDKYIDTLSKTPHRHDHYTLMWITKGHGKQRINGNEYEMLTNRVFFLHPGQIHTMQDFDRDGWLLLFGEVLYKTFLKFHPLEEYLGMMDITGDCPYVDLNQNATEIFQTIFRLIGQLIKNESADNQIYMHLIATLLLTSNQLFHKEIKKTKSSNEDKNLIRQLKLLIEDQFRTKQNVSFYAEELNIRTRRLNDIVKTNTGQSVHNIIEERLLTESKILLSSSPLTVKEISYSLGFTDPSYFNRFFKRKTKITPLHFRSAKD